MRVRIFAGSVNLPKSFVGFCSTPHGRTAAVMTLVQYQFRTAGPLCACASGRDEHHTWKAENNWIDYGRESRMRYGNCRICQAPLVTFGNLGSSSEITPFLMAKRVNPATEWMFSFSMIRSRCVSIVR